jgi:hypothetical protein
MTEKHPLVQAALIELEEIKSQIRGEIAASKAGLKAELDLSDIAIGSLDEQRIDLETRMTRVAGLRAKYGNLTLETEKQSELLSEAVRDLIDARSQHAAAEATSVLTFIGSPTTGGQPLPPGRMTIAALSLLAGAFAGLSCLALTVPWRYVSQEVVAAPVSTASAMQPVEPSEVDYVRLSREEFERLTSLTKRSVESDVAETTEATPAEAIAPAEEPASNVEDDWLEEEEIEIATLNRGATDDLRLPDSVLGRAHGIDLSGWGPLPNIYPSVAANSSEPSEDGEFFQTPADPESAEVSVPSEEPSSPERSVQPAQNERADRPAATPHRAQAFPARLYPGMHPKRKLSLRQALVTLAKRRPGRP